MGRMKVPQKMRMLQKDWYKKFGKETHQLTPLIDKEKQMSRSTVYITLTGTRKAQTAKAVLFSVHAISGTPVDLEQKDQWFPLSQIQKMTTDPNKVGEDIIVASEWICKEKGLLENAARATKVKQDAHGFDKLETFPDEDFPDEEDPYVGQFD